MSAASPAPAAPPGGTRGGPGSRVIIVGGGLAGIAAAVALEAAGRSVTLLESRHALGGRAGSFEDPQTDGQLLDNCQHVLLGCCTNLMDLYRRLGVAEKIRYERRVHFFNGTGRRYDLWGVSGLPAPLHLAAAMAFFGGLTIGERIAVKRAMLAMMRLGIAGRHKLEGMPFGAWLDEHQQPAGVVEKFYDPVLVSALNEETRRASAKYAIQVFQDAMLTNSRGYVVGLPACPLGELYARAPCADLRLGTRVSEIIFTDSGAAGVLLQSGERLDGDAVILATNHHAVQRWIPRELQHSDARFSGLDKLQSVPILGAHLWFDRPVMAQSHAALMKGPLQWLFRKDAQGQAIHGVISAARAWTGVAKEECLRQFERQIRGLFAEARDARLLRGLIVIEKRATFSPAPGTDANRPQQAPPEGGIANLFLAGDYTQTDWPATMEGAVRSGYRAADALLGPSGRPATPFLVPDLPPQWPARLLVRN